MITIHELYHLSLNYGVGGRFIHVKRDLDSLFRVIPLDQNTCLKASELRKMDLPEADALILATAVVRRFSEFYTFDGDFEGFDGRKIGGTLVRYLTRAGT